MDLKTEHSFLKKMLFKTNKVYWLRFYATKIRKWLYFMIEEHYFLSYIVAIISPFVLYFFLKKFLNIMFGVEPLPSFFLSLLIMLCILFAAKIIVDLFSYFIKNETFLERIFESKQSKEDFILSLQNIDSVELRYCIKYYDRKSTMLFHLLDKNEKNQHQKKIEQKQKLKEEAKKIQLAKEKEKEEKVKLEREALLKMIDRLEKQQNLKEKN